VAVFLNGVPFYNPTSPVSYRDQNLWHLDAVAAYRRNARAASPLLESLLAGNGRHSPLIGFALDGYPVYGPYGWDASGQVQRIRSSYRLRPVTNRRVLPDGTELTPSQEGPAIGGEFPLGTFVEDYEYAAGSGDLDEHNGRFTRTPEYPSGTYAYFLSSYPYLVGPTYYGAVDGGSDEPEFTRNGDLLRFTIRDSHGRKIRFLEKVHEQPVHLVIVSSDLAEFAHIHPELQDDDSYTVSYSFPHKGTYSLFADFTRPGESQTIARYHVHADGPPRAPLPPRPDTEWTKTQDGITVRMTPPQRLVAGTDLRFRFDISVDDLQPYLGAWAHMMIVSGNRSEFIHAHPLAESAPDGEHMHEALGPSPRFVETITGFNKPGLYRMWVQFQRQGRVIAVPFTFRVGPALSRPARTTTVPARAVRVRVSASGFAPDRITLPAGHSATIAFERTDAQNCASSVVFPELGIRWELPAGQTTVVTIPALPARELHFACGMGMYRGSLRLVSNPDRRTPR
jgi:hypothetical protein